MRRQLVDGLLTNLLQDVRFLHVYCETHLVDKLLEQHCHNILLTSYWNSIVTTCDNAVPTTCQQDVFHNRLVASLLASWNNAVSTTCQQDVHVCNMLVVLTSCENAVPTTHLC